VLELTQLAGLDIREDVFLIVSCPRSVAWLRFAVLLFLEALAHEQFLEALAHEQLV
jgi:hypothetical protein